MKLKLGTYEDKFEDIVKATENFATKYCIVSGGFGSVYIAELVHVDKAYIFAPDNENEREVPKKRSTVAIKRINNIEDEMSQQGFQAEIEMLTSCKHSNIITLLGFCDEGRALILIYKYASNGSLNYYLQKTRDNENDSWAQRVKICLDIAKGLRYLHTTEGDRDVIVHPVLSHITLLGAFCEKPMSSSSFLIQRTSLNPRAIPLNSASALDRATTFCFLLIQVTRFPPTKEKYPDVDLRFPLSPAQSTSV
ncbi:putative protein kinase RLK-Pelle-SD-2b family [Helianthus anomalus]